MASLHPALRTSFRLDLWGANDLPDLLDYNVLTPSILPELKEAVTFHQFDCIKDIIANLVEQLMIHHKEIQATGKTTCYEKISNLVHEMRERNAWVAAHPELVPTVKPPSKFKRAAPKPPPSAKIARRRDDEADSDGKSVKRSKKRGTRNSVPAGADADDGGDQAISRSFLTLDTSPESLPLVRSSKRPLSVRSVTFTPPPPPRDRFEQAANGTESAARQLFVHIEEGNKDCFEAVLRKDLPIGDGFCSLSTRRPLPSSITVTEDGRLRWKARPLTPPPRFKEPIPRIRPRNGPTTDFSRIDEAIAAFQKQPTTPPTVPESTVTAPRHPPLELMPTAPVPPLPSRMTHQFAVPAPRPPRTPGIEPTRGVQFVTPAPRRSLGIKPIRGASSVIPMAPRASTSLSRPPLSFAETVENEWSYEADVQTICNYVMNEKWKEACNYIHVIINEDEPVLKATKDDFFRLIEPMKGLKDSICERIPSLMVVTPLWEPVDVRPPSTFGPGLTPLTSPDAAINPYKLQVDMIATYIAAKEWKSGSELLWKLLKKTGHCTVTTQEQLRVLLKEDATIFSGVVNELITEGTDCTFWLS